MSTAFSEDQERSFEELLLPGRLLAVEARQVLLYASRFSRIEEDFRAIRLHKGARPLRIAVLATLSMQHFSSVLRLFLYADGVVPHFEFSGFDGIATAGRDPDSAVWDSSPDVLLVMPAIEDIKSWPPMFARNEEIQDWVLSCASRYTRIWQLAGERMPDCHIYQACFAAPFERPLGNLERLYPFSRTNCLAALNAFLLEHRHPNVTILDMDALSGLAGRRHWVDEAAYFTSKQPFSIREMPVVAAKLSRMVTARLGMVYKCLVLDLDNTLWGGVIGDDGVDGIRLDPNDPLGEAFLAFQRYVLALKERGVLLAVCSKNEAAVARDAFDQHPDMLLRLQDFSAFVVNWEDKASNLRRIASQLNIGIESLVFFDDNPAERALVRQMEPSVFVVDVPDDPALFVRTLDLSFAFEWPELTVEDIGRSDSYADNQKRQEMENAAESYEAYLASLKMRVSIEQTQEGAISRVCQLINKTNQFNLRTRRYHEEQVRRLVDSPDHCLLHVRLSDRFTNYGIVASVVLRYIGDLVFVDNWVMSCRVFERGVEAATFNAILANARSRGAKWLAAEYIQTQKNVYVATLLEGFGLVQWDSAPGLPNQPDDFGEGTRYIQHLSALLERPHVIDLTGADDS